jgi:hypothetical protein
MAHRIVWCSVATVDRKGRPRSRVLHPIWEWDGTELVGWVGTAPTPLKRAHTEAHPHVSLNYWEPSQDTAVAEWPPLGYDPSIIPGWDGPTCDAFAALRLDPWRLRVFPGSVLMGQGGDVLTWST